MTDYTYFSDQENPAIQLEWLDGNGAVINFSSGYTFSAKLVDHTNAIAYTTTSVTGAATTPNITITWLAGAFTGLEGRYELHVYATTGGKDNVFSPGNPPIVLIKTPAAGVAISPTDTRLAVAAALESVVLGFNEAAPGAGVWIRLPA